MHFRDYCDSKLTINSKDVTWYGHCLNSYFIITIKISLWKLQQDSIFLDIAFHVFLIFIHMLIHLCYA